MSLLNCFCTSRTQVQSRGPEQRSETGVHQNLVDKPTLPRLPLSTRRSVVVGAAAVSHQGLRVETGRGSGDRASVHLARHTPTATLATTNPTDLEDGTEERPRALQKAVILPHFSRHPNITTYWTVFTVGSWLGIISLLMAYDSAS